MKNKSKKQDESLKKKEVKTKEQNILFPLNESYSSGPSQYPKD